MSKKIIIIVIINNDIILYLTIELDGGFSMKTDSLQVP